MGASGSSMNTRELGQLIEEFAPLSLQEEWDNSGFNVDLGNEDIGRVLVCLDATMPVIEEAAEKKCGAIVSHHPLLFRPLRNVRVDGSAGERVAALCRHGISLYCSHTPMDSSPAGINAALADLLHLQDAKPLVPSRGHRLYKLSVTVPTAHAEDVWRALTQSGAGRLDGYADCTFAFPGKGTFRALPGSAPFIGKEWSLEQVDEICVQALVTSENVPDAVEAVRGAHPYEVPAIDLIVLEDTRPRHAGMGRVGRLEAPVTLSEFAKACQETLDAPGIRVHGDPDRKVSRVALCGGAGGDLVDEAVQARADVLLTGEVKHNVYEETSLALVEAGHYDTEKCFAQAMQKALQKHLLDVEYKVEICVSQHMRRPYTVI